MLPILLLAACNQNQQQSHTADSTTQTSGSLSTTFKPADANKQAIYSRAYNAVIWGMPAVNCELMYQSLVRAKGDWNQIVYWSALPSWKNQTITPNPDVIYFHFSIQKMSLL